MARTGHKMGKFFKKWVMIIPDAFLENFEVSPAWAPTLIITSIIACYFGDGYSKLRFPQSDTPFGAYSRGARNYGCKVKVGRLLCRILLQILR